MNKEQTEKVQTAVISTLGRILPNPEDAQMLAAKFLQRVKQEPESLHSMNVILRMSVHNGELVVENTDDASEKIDNLLHPEEPESAFVSPREMSHTMARMMNFLGAIMDEPRPLESLTPPQAAAETLLSIYADLDKYEEDAQTEFIEHIGRRIQERIDTLRDEHMKGF